MNEWLWFKNLTPDEESAGIITDKSGNGRDGTLVGSAEVFNYAARGKVLNFPLSASSHVEVTTDTFLPSTGITMGAWIWRADNSSAVIAYRENSWKFWFPYDDENAGKLCLSVRMDGWWHDILSDTAVPIQQWVFVQATFGLSNDGVIFIHGSARGHTPNVAGSVTCTNATIMLGKHPTEGRQFHGSIGEFMIRDAYVDLTTHRADLKRWLKREQAKVVELLELHVPGETLRFCSRPDPITLTVYDI
ncbi:MAG: LamG domain-containing protein [Magnetococcales bacterium]|nr:LamG domain-containing protein [Magnetococcales bacterium]